MADAAHAAPLHRAGTRLSGQRLLVVGPSWVGDMVMAQSLFMTLKQQGAASLAVVAPSWSRPILERMDEIDEVVELGVGHGVFGLAPRHRLAQSLKGASTWPWCCRARGSQRWCRFWPGCHGGWGSPVNIATGF